MQWRFWMKIDIVSSYSSPTYCSVPVQYHITPLNSILSNRNTAVCTTWQWFFRHYTQVCDFAMTPSRSCAWKPWSCKCRKCTEYSDVKCQRTVAFIKNGSKYYEEYLCCILCNRNDNTRKQLNKQTETLEKYFFAEYLMYRNKKLSGSFNFLYNIPL